MAETRSETEVRRQILSQQRAMPTPEDQAIFQRQLCRVIIGCDRAGRTPQEKMAIVRRWTLDYIGIRA